LPATSIVNLVGSDRVTINLKLASLTQAEKPVDVGPRNRAIVAWSATGVLAVSAVVSGAFALDAQSRLQRHRGRPDRRTLISSRPIRRT